MVETRTIAVPEGLSGERLDVVLSRLFGFSRAFAQDIIEHGGAVLAGKPGHKSDRVTSGVMLDVTFEPKKPPSIEPVIIESMAILYDDDDVVVVDRNIDVHIRGIRKKMDFYPPLIETIRGVGYRLRDIT